jgi:hypothetical protein
MAPIFLFVNKRSATVGTADIRVLLAIPPSEILNPFENLTTRFFRSHVYSDCASGLIQEPLFVKYK